MVKRSESNMLSKTDESMEAKEKVSHSTTDESLDIEPLLQALGWRGLGVYQVMQMALHLSCLFGLAFSIMSVVFIGYKPPYHCASVNTTELETAIGWSENDTADMAVTYQKCSIEVETNISGQIDVYSLPCLEGFEYEGGGKYTSFFTEWDLTCEKSVLTEVTQTLMMVGQGFGACVFSSIADRFGRKPVYVSSSIAMLVVAIATALSPNYYFFIFCRVATGAIQQGTGLVGFTMFIELLPKDMRLVAGLVDGGLWSSGMMMLPALAYLLQDFSWRYLQLAIAAFSAVSLLFPFVVDESLRWLVANKKKAEAERVLKKACRINRVDYHKVRTILDSILNDQPTAELHTSSSANENVEKFLGHEVNSVKTNETLDKSLLDDSVTSNGEPINEKNELHKPINGAVAEALGEQDSEEVKKYSLLDVFRSKLLMKTTLIIAFMWITCSLTYYGLMLTTATVAGNRFFNFFLQALIEFPAYVTAYFCLRKIGRRNVISGLLLLTAVALMASSIVLGTVTNPVVGPVSNFLTLVGKYGVSGSFCAIFIYSPELFPTNLRTAGLGLSSAFARGGSMVAPYMYNLAEIAIWAPWAIYSCMTVMTAFLIKKLPETRGRPMPTTIDEMKAWNRKKSQNKGSDTV